MEGEGGGLSLEARFDPHLFLNFTLLLQFNNWKHWKNKEDQSLLKSRYAQTTELCGL